MDCLRLNRIAIQVCENLFSILKKEKAEHLNSPKKHTITHKEVKNLLSAKNYLLCLAVKAAAPPLRSCSAQNAKISVSLLRSSATNNVSKPTGIRTSPSIRNTMPCP